MRFAICVLVCVCGLFVRHSLGDHPFDTYRPTMDGDTASDDNTQHQHHPPSMLCLNIKPQHSVDIEQITGMWYGNEIIMHTQDVPGVYRYDSCVIVHLSDVTDQMRRNYNYNNYRRLSSATSATQHRHHYQQQAQQEQYDGGPHEAGVATRYLRLIWSEKDDNIEYNFNYTANRPGLWTNVGEQRGSMVALNQYTQFTGTVQVVKAVSDHLVLTFCASDLHHSIYTVVLSREAQGLSSEIIRSIRNLLSRRGLYTESIRKVCTSSAAAHRSSVALALLASYLFVVGRRF